MIDIERLNRIEFGYNIVPALIGAAALVGSTIYSNLSNRRNAEDTRLAQSRWRVEDKDYNTQERLAAQYQS